MNRHERLQILKTNFDKFISTFSVEDQDKFKEVSNKRDEATNISLSNFKENNVISIENRDYIDKLRSDAKTIEREISISFLERFCSSKDTAERSFNNFKNPKNFTEMVTNFLEHKLLGIGKDLAYPNNPVWKKDCIPLKGSVEVDGKLYDLGIVFEGYYWLAVVADGNNGGDYYTSDDWLNKEIYKLTFLEALKYGIFNLEDQASIISKYGIMDKLWSKSIDEMKDIANEQ